MENSRLLHVFLCHASQDKPAVRKLYDRLKNEGWIQPWLDEEDLLPGQEWNVEIPIAVRSSDVVIVCLSKQSITKEGYVQREISLTLDIADEKPEGTIFVIPLLLEKCKVPRRMERWQWLDYNVDGAYEKLMRSLTYRADSLRLRQDLKSAAETSTDKTHFVSLGLTPPISQTMTTYVFGDDLFDESFSINAENGEFIGEYGVGIAEYVGAGKPMQATALEVWLFDKYTIATSAKVIMSNYAFNDKRIRARLEQRGELNLASVNKQYLVETSALQMLVTIVDMEYGKGAMPIDSFFRRITFEIAIWRKE
jgi:hypothetical protein